MDPKSYKPVEGAKVSIKDENGESTDAGTTDDKGKITDISLEPGKVYTVFASQGEMNGKEITVSTKGMKGNKKITKNLYTAKTAKTETYNVYAPVSGSFKHFFEYNKTDIEQNPNYTQFLADLDNAIAKNGTVTIKITGTASTVPTKLEGGNKGLAKTRAESMQKTLSDYLSGKGVDLNKIKFEINARVAGPTYNSDYLVNKRTYEKYQFVEVTLK